MWNLLCVAVGSVAWLFGCLSMEGPVRAADPAGLAVAAYVGEKPIPASAVSQAVQAALQGREATPQAVAVFQAQALEQLIGRKLIESHLIREREIAAEHEVAQAWEEMQAKLKQQGIALDALLAQRGFTEEALRAELLWEVSWKKYLAKHVTDETLAAYFQAHARAFDGTKLGVSHILLRPVNNSPAALADVLKQAEALRARLLAGKLGFAEAAQAYSVGPSREQGGELGFIPRQGVMEEAFAQAAFALEVGEISPPVRTRFGVHLIRVTKIQPGEKRWNDVREQLLQPVAQELFQKLATAERERTPVRYTGATPHIRPGTQEWSCRAECEDVQVEAFKVPLA